MCTETRSPGDSAASDAEVVATVDGAGRDARFVVADIAREEAWISATAARARSLDDWR
ncbi:DUF7556 family protein [Halosimplex sp. J119]